MPSVDCVFVAILDILDFAAKLQFATFELEKGRPIMKILATAVSALALVLGLATSADAGVRAGVLHCQAGKKVGAILGSTEEARCVFTRYNGKRERYVALIERAGVDIGVVEHSELVWAVYAPTNLHHRALTGEYVGASADVAVGIGGGANLLIGGSANTISLQPLSVKVQSGLAVGVGAGRISLR
jgi:hypothetical protein